MFDEKSEPLVKKHQFTMKINSLAYNIGKLLESASVRNRMTDMELNNEELDKTMKMLEDLNSQLQQFKED